MTLTLTESLVQPVTQVLDGSKLAIGDVTVCELIGGGVRLPGIPRQLQSVHKSLVLGRYALHEAQRCLMHEAFEWR